MRLAPAFVALACALVVACVPGDRTQGALEGTPTARPGARPGGTLRVAITPPDGVDPTGAHEAAGELITATMCDQLVTFDPVTGALAPGLAEWTVGDGGRNVFLRISGEARFSDGTPVTAEDVRFTLSRLADDDFASPSASLMEPVVGYGFTHGDDETDEESLRRTLLGVSIVNASTVSISLERPNADFVRTLAHPATSPVARSAVLRNAVAFARRPVCAGPYRLASPYEPGEQVVLERTPGYGGYNRTLTRAGRGYAERIEFQVAPSRARAARLVRSGRADVGPLSGRVPAGARAERVPSSMIEFIGFPTTQPPFDDARVRLALSQAIDRRALARAVYGRSRAATSAFVPEQIAGTPEACARNAPARADVRSARSHLARAGVDPRELRPALHFNDEFANRALVREIARQWREGLSVRARLVPLPWERYRSLATRPRGFEGPFRFSWSAEVHSVEQIVAPLFTVRGIGSDNWSLYSSRDLDDAMREAREAADATDRARNHQRALAILCDEMPMAPLVRAMRGYVLRDEVRSAVDVIANAIDGSLLLRELTVS